MGNRFPSISSLRENVLVQLDHLKTHQAIATRLRRGDLRLHGWVYSTGPGDVQVYGWEKRDLVDPGEKQ